MGKIFIILMMCLAMLNADEVPKYLYKVLSVENWENSQGKSSLQLPEADREFIHLAMENQVDKVIENYWKDVPEFMVLKLDSSQLPGRLIFEANPGKTNKYYHLYNGSIPLNAVVESKKITVE